MRISHASARKVDQNVDLESSSRPQKNRLNLILWLLGVITIIALYLGGIFSYLLEEDFTNYERSTRIDNFREVIEAIDRKCLTSMNHNFTKACGQADIVNILETMIAEHPSIKNVVPLNQFDGFNYTINIKPKCQELWQHDRSNSKTFANVTSLDASTTMILIVKSAVNNHAQRQAIRKSWYLNETTNDLIALRTVFMVGACHERNPVPSRGPLTENFKSWSPDKCDKAIRNESARYGDVIQSSAIDTYYNNTIKTFMTYRWVVEHCHADFMMALDDDYVFEVENLLTYLRSLSSLNIRDDSLVKSLPLDPPIDGGSSHQNPIVVKSSNQGTSSRDNLPESQQDKLRGLSNLRSLSEQYLYAGYLMNYVHPLRSVLSKWYISRRDYPYNTYPPYITGGAYLMSFKTIRHFYLTSFFVRSFRFDDVYVGMMAYELGLSPIHNELFMCDINAYIAAKPVYPNTTNCIGVHEIEPDELINLWKKRKALGVQSVS